MALRTAKHRAQPPEAPESAPPEDMASLLATLAHGDAGQRRRAVRLLAGLPHASAALGQQLLIESDSSVRESIFIGLAARASAAAVDALLPCLRSEDAGLRNGAIEALAAMPEATAPRITQLLKDADTDVRIFTVNLLGELRHPQVRQWLLCALQGDPEVNVVAAAIEALAEVGQPEDLPALEAARQRFAGDVFIGFAAGVAAERICRN